MHTHNDAFRRKAALKRKYTNNFSYMQLKTNCIRKFPKCRNLECKQSIWGSPNHSLHKLSVLKKVYI
uniref:Putative ovule protein n=1 Tax=Solanum chacoense TaxID=4108 RepID=A0A0V0HJ97_SOLCH